MKQIIIILLLAGMAGAQEGIYSVRRNGWGTPPTNYTFWKKATGRIYLEHKSWADSVFMISGDDTIQLVPKVKTRVKAMPDTTWDSVKVYKRHRKNNAMPYDVHYEWPGEYHYTWLDSWHYFGKRWMWRIGGKPKPRPITNTIGTSALTFSPSEVHLTPRPDTTTIYIYYTGGEVDTIKALPIKAKPDSFLLKFREAVICSVARQQIK